MGARPAANGDGRQDGAALARFDARHERLRDEAQPVDDLETRSTGKAGIKGLSRHRLRAQVVSKEPCNSDICPDDAEGPPCKSGCKRKDGENYSPRP